MDPNLLTAVITSSSTALVAITALLLNNKRFDLIDKRLDIIDKRFESFERKLDKLDTSIEMLTGTTAELDKRLSIIEDRIFHR